MEEVDENSNLCSQEKREWTEEQWQQVTEWRKKGEIQAVITETAKRLIFLYFTPSDLLAAFWYVALSAFTNTLSSVFIFLLHKDHCWLII